MRIPEDALQSVVYLGTIGNYQGEKAGIELAGTGFFVSIPSNLGGSFVYIVTAAHVARDLEDTAWGFRGNSSDKNHPLKIFPALEDIKWEYHDDPSVDIAIALIGLPDDLLYKSIKFGRTHKERWEIVEKNHALLKEKPILGHEVAIIGLLPFIPGEKVNTPIARFGNISLEPSGLIPWKENNRVKMIEAYVIEARSIGGLSGSPVFIDIGDDNGPLYFLIGTVRGHWDKENVNTGIAAVEPYHKLVEILDKPSLIKAREEMEEKYTKQVQAANDGVSAVNDSAITSAQDAEERGDNILKNMLNTPPDPRK